MVVPHCLHQEGVVLQEAVEKRPGHEALPYSPVLHDLSLTPRNMRAVEVVEFWLEMYETKDVTEWYQHMEVIDMPRIQVVTVTLLTYSGHPLLDRCHSPELWGTSLCWSWALTRPSTSPRH